ncbi:oligopeptidase A [Aeromonas hydrophila]|uniref:oligopeptidase A n=1 Tax=Aeromonas hydrophila subsp. hydrophila (strain ATCC 7966 / DSM 30187 / BCRC 13018 / CCUG 14551 / JCM 1027 / KCTC 2358 / NCIMB 9240 / NCTC 8049) TaxID=380703 RepID=A0KEG4_AERHH|nr:oligopeptidase A [Aeromonas hydrophila]ABK38002.1 oligopeptidase A [Aeromonas hydrophila subsp. hydrophila ATCC 7966]AWA08599.1 oligopeptidase A [Aeromonas hydrophila subsp. hydrophila]MBS4674100.1 oligopeptidase A [Aeromonas hydrophila]OOD30991.1 oligopeptidase A [Aeromonas hydrophila]QPR88442.1 oligopeptidase A [Aeromonas hydrophila]
MNNPLLTMDSLPPFSQIQPDQVQPAVTQAIADCKQKISDVLAQRDPHTWDSLIAPLEEVNDRLARIWSPVSHLNSVLNSEALRAAHDACLPLLSEFQTYVGQHEGLYQAYRELAESDDFPLLSGAQRKEIQNTLRDFRLSGIGLPAEAQQRYGEIQARLSELASRFSNNVLDATQGWNKLVTDEAELAGLPQSAQAAARQLAELKGKEGWLFTLDIPSYLPVMMYADNRALRAELYEAFTTRASDQGPNAGKWDNSAIMTELLALRRELAQLLGFANYAELSLATKMADKPEQVVNFLTDLAAKSLPQGKAELEEIRAFAAEQHGQGELAAWDLAYYAEKLKQHKFSISDEQLRPYFPASKVVKGLFEVVKRVFGMKVRERLGIDTWHPDVRFYDIFDAEDELRGSFYLDLYAREHKQGGAWMDVCLGRRYRQDGSLQKPVAYLTCNFNGPVDGKPALFTHNEVVTLFHEFGHGIHHMLTRIDVAGVAGINGVAWDAVELPSQFLENWCWESEALAFISGHHETGEPLPADLLEKMLTARNFQAAMQMLRQLEFALFDFRLHQEFDPASTDQIPALLDEVRSQVAVMTPPAFNRFQHSFSHIFAGGYAAGYYSYKWAEVLSADAFSRFEEEGIFNPATGQSFLKNILEKGGSKEPMELFRAFRGREPQVDALLRHSGIAA